MLGALVMHLQRQLGAGIDGDVLDLEIVADVDALIGAPGPVDLAMGGVQLAA